MRRIAVVRSIVFGGTIFAVMLGAWTTLATHPALADGGNKKLDIYDNCDPRDPGWAPTGGCLLEPREGDVTLAEFNRLLLSPLSAAVVGHPSWRFEPTYLHVTAGKRLRVTNEGGRDHTFTQVANFGGGVVPPLSVGLMPAPECAASSRIHPGDAVDVTVLKPGLHTFQCCIHPWMRAAVRVNPPEDDDESRDR